ncbi:MAG: tetratricopeptide repeat protein, partial [Elusimicrobia bacterium]|nr:tetratricopeptide repeat protein [Elusimicrobiota bacterium]
GEMFRREGQNARALECARRSLASAPGNPAARLLEAQALEGLGQKARAHAAYKSLLKDYPGRRDFRNWAAAAGVTPGA